MDLRPRYLLAASGPQSPGRISWSQLALIRPHRDLSGEETLEDLQEGQVLRGCLELHELDNDALRSNVYFLVSRLHYMEGAK